MFIFKAPDWWRKIRGRLYRFAMGFQALRPALFEIGWRGEILREMSSSNGSNVDYPLVYQRVNNEKFGSFMANIFVSQPHRNYQQNSSIGDDCSLGRPH